jgi:hypothetical protein
MRPNIRYGSVFVVSMKLVVIGIRSSAGTSMCMFCGGRISMVMVDLNAVRIVRVTGSFGYGSVALIMGVRLCCDWRNRSLIIVSIMIMIRETSAARPNNFGIMLVV